MNRIIYKEWSDKLLYICISFTLIYVVMKKIIIAIDGVSSTGKSTMAKDLARELGYTYIDTGAMYRAVTLYSLQHGFFTSGGIDEQKLQDAMNDIDISFRFNPETGRPDTYLNGVKVEKEIRGMEVANRVSPIAALGFVRRAMVAKQQEMGKAKGIVMDGRDIGTTVLPDAQVKVFLVASAHERARRRYEENLQKGLATQSLDELEAAIKLRDQKDSTRKVSPLTQAKDAILIDTTSLTIDQVVDEISALIKKNQDN
ncbi:MAG TPA: (d)CMP kinase [Lactobacillus sp.]|nr:(d)CMP kinase [Lactobacillus sp.]